MSARHYRQIPAALALQMLLQNPVLSFAVPFHSASSQEILEAMRSQSGYEVTATTNVARFQGSVLIKIAEMTRAVDSSRSVLFIDHEKWMTAYLKFTGLTESTLPIHAQLALRHRQDLLLDFTKGRVIEKIEAGDHPQMAINVTIGWPDDKVLPEKYSFLDTLSTPRLQVTNHREVTFRLLDFGDMIVYDDIRGLTGRPTSGLLGVLFKVIGEGSVVQSKIKIATDGLQINRAHAEKGLIGVTETVTVKPDGISEKGLPDNRPDLEALENLLKRPLSIEYFPLKFEGLEAVWSTQFNGDIHTNVHHE